MVAPLTKTVRVKLTPDTVANLAGTSAGLRRRLQRYLGRQYQKIVVDVNFRSGGRPRWKRLSRAYARHKLMAGKPPIANLVWSGRLRRVALSAKAIEPELRAFHIVVDVPYARVHEKGYARRRIPRRPFLKALPADMVALAELAALWVAAETVSGVGKAAKAVRETLRKAMKRAVGVPKEGRIRPSGPIATETTVSEIQEAIARVRMILGEPVGRARVLFGPKAPAPVTTWEVSGAG